MRPSNLRYHALLAILTANEAPNFQRTAEVLASQLHQSTHTVEILLVDNTPHGHSSSSLVESFSAHSLQAASVNENRSGIPFARNAAIRVALNRGVDCLIFLDDDELPSSAWLNELVSTWQRTSADIVLGPANGLLPEDAPRWARDSKMFDKDRRLPDGAPIRTAYSYNTLLSRRTLETLGATFDPVFRFIGASDHDYFKRATAAGLCSVWSPNAVVYEEIGPERLRVWWVVKRGYRTGIGARISARRRLPRRRALVRIALLTLANAGYAVLNIVGTQHPRLSWVEGLRRGAVAVGLAVGNVLKYEEYVRTS
jgi:GT2 family glycosyltransferase